MSLFQTATVNCPACSKPVEFGVVDSLNADRRPDLRAAILDRSFQTQRCACGETFRLEPRMTYLDVRRKQWILVEPLHKLAEWSALEEKARTTFEAAYGARAAAAARKVAVGMQVRVTFGWAALHEKLLCREHGIDDVILEIIKATLLRTQPNTPLADDTELRLVDVLDDKLRMCWLRATTEGILEDLRIPRSLCDDITSDPDGYQRLSSQLTAGPFVDLHRVLVPATGK